MAGTVTHAFFAIDVYNSLNQKLKTNLKDYQNNLKTFGQGHDVFSFSNKHKSNEFHNNNTRDFFINTINYIKNNNLNDNYEILSYLYGYICHYVLDKSIHPFVAYKTGNYVKKYKNTYKYRCKHSDMETYLDSYMINMKENMEPGKFKSHKYCLEPYKFSKELNDVIDYSFYSTFNLKKANKYYRQGIRRMHYLYPLLRNDKYGIKKKIYRIVDKITPKYSYKFSPISFAYKPNEKDYYLNLDRKEWNHPMYKDEKYHTSAIDIYNNSIKEAKSIIENVDKYLCGKDIDLNIIFDNSSFSTGKDCNDKTIQQFFEN